MADLLIGILKFLMFLAGCLLLVGGGLGGFCGLVVHEGSIFLVGLLAVIIGVGLIVAVFSNKKESPEETASQYPPQSESASQEEDSAGQP